MFGAEITLSSSTIANGLPTFSCVILPNLRDGWKDGTDGPVLRRLMTRPAGGSARCWGQRRTRCTPTTCTSTWRRGGPAPIASRAMPRGVWNDGAGSKEKVRAMTITVHEPAVAPKCREALLARWRRYRRRSSPSISRRSGRSIRRSGRCVRAGRQAGLFGRAVTVRVRGAGIRRGGLLGVGAIRPGEVLVIDAGGDAATAMIGDVLGGTCTGRARRGRLRRGDPRRGRPRRRWRGSRPTRGR